MISKFFIDRPIFANVIAILTVLGGFVAMFALPIAQYPEIVPPTVVVSASYPGADPQTVAETVAVPIEEQVNGVDNMLYMSSACNRDGSYNLTVTFDLGVDPNMAQVLVQNRVNIASSRLPDDVNRQGVTVKKRSSNYVIIGQLCSPKGSYDSMFLANHAILNMQDNIARVPGVGDVKVYPSGKDYSLRVWMDPGLLEARGLATDDVLNALREQNVQVAAGQLGQAPSPADQTFQYTVTALGRLRDVNQFNDIVLKTGKDSRIVRMRDVARVEIGAQTYDTTSTLDGKPSATLVVYQLPGSNALDVAKGVKKTIYDLAAEFPQDVEYRMLWDLSDFVGASVREVIETLVIAFILVAIVVFVFLGNFRATMIPVTTVPVSLIGTFLVMAGMGFSINTLTLFGLVLAIGIVVDDAIVVTENAQRIIDEEGLPPREATIKAMEEITGPVIGITLVLMAVFLPTAFLPGIAGQMYRQFALTIAATTGISALNALTLKPAQCAVFLKKRPAKASLFSRVFDAGFGKVAALHKGVAWLAVRRLAIAVLLYAGFVVLAAMGFLRLPTGFIPQEDQGLIAVNAQLPAAASSVRNARLLQQAQAVAHRTPGIDGVVMIGGYSMLDQVSSSDVGFGFISLKPWEERYSRQNRDAQDLTAIAGGLRRGLGSLQDGAVVSFPLPPILGLGSSAGFRMQLLDKGDLGLMALTQAAQALTQAAAADPRLVNVNMRFDPRTPQFFADVDREKVKTMGVPLQAVFTALQAHLGSSYVNDLTLFGRAEQVRVQADAEFRAGPEDVRGIYVRSNAGKMIPLGTLVTMRPQTGPPYLARYNLYPTVAVNGEAAPGVSSGQALKVMEEIAARELPPGIGFEWTDIAYQEKRVGATALIAFALAVIVVYLVLAAQYESWSSPFAVAMAVPTAVMGAVAAIWIRGMDVNLFTQIGLVLLVALSAKNAILIVEFARDGRKRGEGLAEAAVNAARVRLRPILMTSVAFNLGVLPLVIATGAGAAGRQALGTAVFGGMLAATLFPIVFVPTFYVICQGISEWLARRRGKASPAPSAPSA